jgi:hypothetical protein
MQRIKVLLILLSLLALLSILHAFGVYAGLYENLTWYDFITHFLGGVCVGFGALWLHLYLGASARFFYWTLAWVLVIGILWEMFEYFGGAMRENSYKIDTIIDLILDTAGALIVWARTKKYVLQ